jgi:hypothetical protein
MADVSKEEQQELLPNDEYQHPSRMEVEVHLPSLFSGS